MAHDDDCATYRGGSCTCEQVIAAREAGMNPRGIPDGFEAIEPAPKTHHHLTPPPMNFFVAKGDRIRCEECGTTFEAKTQPAHQAQSSNGLSWVRIDVGTPAKAER